LRPAGFEAADTGARAGELRLGHADAGGGSVASRGQPVDVRPRNEAARDQALGAIQILLGEAKIRLRDLNAGGKLRCFLCLHGAVDHGQHLAAAHPLAGLDQHAHDLAAFAGNADRHVAARGERAGRGDAAADLTPARGNDGNRRQGAATLLRARRARAGRRLLGLLAASPEQEDGPDHSDDQHDGRDNDGAPPPRPRIMLGHIDRHILDRVTPPLRRFDIHRLHSPHSRRADCLRFNIGCVTCINHRSQALTPRR